MKVKINKQLICIPPYISARWSQIAFIESQEGDAKGLATLKLHLVDGEVVSIPNLDQAVIDMAFHEHLLYLESTQQGKEDAFQEEKLGSLIGVLQQFSKGCDVQISSPKQLFSSLFSGAIPVDIVLQHTPEQKDQPDAPAEILEKMAAMIRSLAESVPVLLPKPEPHCNCMHCQVARTIADEDEEEVEEEDLKFREWDVIQSGDQLYTVTNPLDPQEQFSVYLGDPIGCTCGQPNCEHIEAVLYT